jgi:DeoR/GlpR family transcriptional regulator of sugar metabolism
MQQHGHVSLQEICARFGISEATARRDLAALVAEKQIVRTYGGALADYNRRFASFHERQQLSAEAKVSMAQAARTFVRPGSTLFMDAGTTIYALAEALARDPLPSLEVVTNNLPVAELLASTAGVRVHLLGGELLPRQSTLAGKAALASLGSYRIDTAFLSAEAMDATGLWNSQDDIAAFQQWVIACAETTIFCVDSAKLGRIAPSFLTGWKPVKALVSDASSEALTAHGIPARLHFT